MARQKFPEVADLEITVLDHTFKGSSGPRQEADLLQKMWSFFSFFFPLLNEPVGTSGFSCLVLFWVLLLFWCRIEYFLCTSQRLRIQEWPLILLQSCSFLPLLKCKVCYDLQRHIFGKLGQGFYNWMLLKPCLNFYRGMLGQWGLLKISIYLRNWGEIQELDFMPWCRKS